MYSAYARIKNVWPARLFAQCKRVLERFLTRKHNGKLAESAVFINMVC